MTINRIALPLDQPVDGFYLGELRAGLLELTRAPHDIDWLLDCNAELTAALVALVETGDAACQFVDGESVIAFDKAMARARDLLQREVG